MSGHDLDGFRLWPGLLGRAEQEALRDQLLHAMTEGSRSSLANLQAALDMLEFPDLEAPMRARFLAVVREETSAMSERIQTLAHTASSSLKTRWPMEEMLERVALD